MNKKEKHPTKRPEGLENFDFSPFKAIVENAPKLTDYERIMLEELVKQAIFLYSGFDTQYFKDILFDHLDELGVENRQAIGLTTSLKKKGYITIQGEGKYATLKLTALASAYLILDGRVHPVTGIPTKKGRGE